MALSAIQQFIPQIMNGSSERVRIEGKDMDRGLLQAAVNKSKKDLSVNGGKVSLEELLHTVGLNPVKDGNVANMKGVRAYTEAEKAAIKFLRGANVLTGAADAELRHEVSVNAGLLGVGGK